MATHALPSVVYHLAEAANWQSIRRHGLLSTSALLDAAGLSGAERHRLERACRPAHTRLPSNVEIRDQRPMPASVLSRCLVGMTPAQWYRLVNRHVFFWLDPERLNRQRAACARRPQVVLVVDTERLVARHASQIALTPINCGNARRRPAARGRSTFVPYETWTESRWAGEAAELGMKERSRSHRPVELAVSGSVPDVMSMLVRAVELAPSQPFGPDCSGVQSTTASAG